MGRLAAAVLAAALATSCSSGGDDPGQVTMCGTLLSYRGPGGPLSFGGCGTHLDPDAPLAQVSMTVGDHFMILGLGEPTSNDEAVVRPTVADVVDDVLSTTLAATAAGRATISVRTVVCGSLPPDPPAPTSTSSTTDPGRVCPFLVVTVAAR